MPGKKLSLRIRYLVISLLFSGLLALPNYIYYYNFENVLIEREGTNAKNLSVAVAAIITENSDAYRALVERPDFGPGTYDKEYYERMLRMFSRLKTGTDVNYLYTERIVGDKTQYVLDAEVPGTEYFSPLGTEEAVSDIELLARETGLPQATGLIDDPVWGVYITGFAPIVDPRDNTFLGLVGVDYSGAHLKNLLKGQVLLLVWTQVPLFLLVLVLMNTVVHRKYKEFKVDHLTGLLNKASFDEELAAAVAELKRGGKSACLAMLDIDNFKQINDTLGHSGGDRVLERLGGIIKTGVRKTDFAARSGGDEFLIFFWDTRPEDAMEVCRRIAERVRGDSVELDDGQTLHYSISVGVAPWQKHMSEKGLTKAADMAMYAAKHQGKNQVVLAD